MGVNDLDHVMGSATDDQWALPASWYRSEQIYELERRAIFSKQWLMACHQSRVKDTGEYVLFTVTGYNFFVLRDRQGEIGQERPQTEGGKANILACKYHGWSYTMKGALAKAPGFDAVPGFVPADNGLWSLRVHIDTLGFIWVSMDKSATAITFEQQFGGFYKQPRVQSIDLSGFEFDHSWSMEDCQFNWKSLCSNYNEHYVECDDNYIAHYAEPNVNHKAGHRQGGQIFPCFIFPYSSFTINPNYMYTMRVVPTSATTTSMQYDVYRLKGCPDEIFNEVDKAYKEIESEDKFLCTNAQKNLNGGTYSTGPLHPVREKGVIFFQNLVKKALVAHRELELVAGEKIYPALQQGQRGETAEDVFCKSLEASCGSDPKLAW
ncbi:hypothetical protein RQP46_000033 [Phenoliferia psychrophenolica]